MPWFRPLEASGIRPIIDREFDLADLRAAFEYQESGRHPRTAQGRVPSALTLGTRPTMELAQYRVPGAKGLYLSGPFMHPGGGLTGGGRPVAMKVKDDIGVDYSKVILS